MLPEEDATERAAVPPPRKVLSQTGHTPRRVTGKSVCLPFYLLAQPASLPACLSVCLSVSIRLCLIFHSVTLSGKLTPIPIAVTVNRRLQRIAEPLEPWSETQLLTEWAREEETKARDYYPHPEGLQVLKAGIAAQTHPEQGSRYLVLRKLDAATTLDVFAPNALITHEPPRGRLPLSHAAVHRSGRAVAVTVHAGVHPDAQSAGATVAFDWERLRDSKLWADAIRSAADLSETAESRERVAQHAAWVAEQQLQRTEASARLEREAARQREGAERASAAAHATLGATAAAARELVERHCSRASMNPPNRATIQTAQTTKSDSVCTDAAEIRGAIADLRAAYHLRALRQQPEDQVPQRQARRENVAARRKQREAAERRGRRAEEQREKNDQFQRQLDDDRNVDPVERAARWGPCRSGDACMLPNCKYSHPREMERKKATIQHAKRAHEEVRSTMWKAKQAQHQVTADFRMGLKLGLKKPLLLPGNYSAHVYGIHALHVMMRLVSHLKSLSMNRIHNQYCQC